MKRYKCSGCLQVFSTVDMRKALLPVPGIGGAVPGAKLVYDSAGVKCYQRCPLCGKVHFHGMEFTEQPE